MPNAWDRLTTETDPAWRAFTHYRDGGKDRSLDAALISAGKKPSNRRTWERWSKTHEWVRRAAAWDAHLDAIKQRAYEESAEAIGRRQAKLGRTLQEAALRHLPSIGGEAPLTGSDVARLAKVGAELERVGAGLPTGRLALEGPGGGPVQVSGDPISLAVAQDPELRAAAVKLLQGLNRPDPPKEASA